MLNLLERKSNLLNTLQKERKNVFTTLITTNGIT